MSLGTPLALGPTGQPLFDPTPETSSPLLALSQYLNGVQYSGGQSLTDNGTQATNPNLQLTLGSGGATGIDQQLAIAQKYDPNAHIEQYDTSSEGNMPMERIDMNQALLPQIPKGYTALGRVSDNSDAGGRQEGQHVYDGAQVYNDPNWGWITPEADINKNYDKHGGGFFGDVGNWGPLLVGAAAGAGALGFLGGGADAGSAVGTGAFDMGGSAGTGIPGSFGLSGAPAASTPSFFDNLGSTIADKLNPTNILTNFQNNLSNPQWWLRQAGQQGLSYLRNQQTAAALRARSGG